MSTLQSGYHVGMVRPREDDTDETAHGRRGEQAAEIAQSLRNDIIEGTLSEGMELRQQQLAERFGVSRMPVREALRHLEAEGLVIFQPNKSARVSPLSVSDLQEIYEMRIAAEALALRLALPELSNAQIDHAGKIQTSIEQAPVADFGTLNAAFHRALYIPCARPRLLAHIEVLSNAADRYLRVSIASLDYAAKSNREHHALLEACLRRDEAAAVSCLTQHIADAGRALAEIMGSSSERFDNKY